ncbi:MAG: aminoacetone oxidase family FAD-binding enzyme [Fimbriimonadaceae bacterium]
MKGPVVVVGAGAAGIIAAWRSASLGAETILLEKTSRIGTKILISGGGKCNITHDGPIEDVLRAFRPNEARFIRPSCYRFLNTEIVEMLTSRGLEVYTRPDGRIFPSTGTAKDVVAILREYLSEVGVKVHLNTAVLDVNFEAGQIATSAGELQAQTVIVATGGSSYPASGTTGDGWPWLRAVGHTIVPIRAALAPVSLKFVDATRSGIALRDCVLKVRQNGKEVARWRDDLLFTHRGLSGPTVLGVSRVASECIESGPVEMEADIAPDRTFESLTAEIIEWVRVNPKKRLSSMADLWVPRSLADSLLASAGTESDQLACNFSQKSRNRLVEVIKGWKLGEVHEVILDKGEVVAGGVDLNEVDPQTMASKRIDRLFLCGEVLDIAGPVGGYNLQAAFATGFVAGESAAQAVLR